uniref:NADH-ubiquinone oxidoreductase chain 6 n=1 Tax=Tanakia himantegus TaxID=481777 RepID=A0A0U1ZXT2_9TELE|nr:NADH dehydrogenase subunit 6 [Tanakia himantegus]AKE35894.1 NADH dehydrogenase subunit 6 [Tanakia himantegus]
MIYLTFLSLMALILDLVAVASVPMSYFARLGKVVAAGVGRGILAGSGNSFLLLVLFLVYLKEMLVVFACSAALAAEPYPEARASRSMLGYVLVCFMEAVLAAEMLGGSWYEKFWVMIDGSKEPSLLWGDVGGMAVMYFFGESLLVICAWVSLLTFLVVLGLTRGLSRGAVRAI